MKRDPLGLAGDWFLPLWRRVAVLAICYGWGAFELFTGNVFFAILFLALGGYATLFWMRRKDE